MDLSKPITPTYAVASQIEPGDMASLAQSGVGTVICNRPDAEVSPDLHAAVMQAAAEAAGLDFVYNPVLGTGMTLENVEEQEAALSAAEGKPVLAYCRSGTRSAAVWALAQAGQMPTDDILAAIATAGYPMDGLRAQIDALAVEI